VELIDLIKSELSNLSFDKKVERINELRQAIHEESPFKSEPVDFVRWVKNETVTANDYNPNKVAPPEMRLLELSIANDGYTQPIVTWDDVEKETIEVIDGFHRNRVGKESKVVAKRVCGYLPIVNIRQEQSNKKDRMASTIRHNRARGKHQVDAMSEIVIELKNRNWNNSRIARELGMDEEEVLRLCQISGIEYLFTDKDFSRAWEADDSNEDWEEMTDEVTDVDMGLVRIPHEGLTDRVFHTYEKWECHKAGFYASNFDGMTKTECEQAYCDFLRDFEKFQEGLDIIITTWKHSCEHYLTNPAMNRIAWLGQAAMCAMTGVPSKYCSGFNLMDDVEKDMANMLALTALNEWMVANDRDELTMDQALSTGRQVEIY
jgi:ParB-like chromosome segregation protein Spo0J